MNDCRNTSRIFCLGLDGGTWAVLRPLMETGHMPQLTALAQSGCSGVLHSTIPPITPAAWSTFMTGCNPGKHGIFDFQGYDRTARKAFYVNATSLRAPTLWEILSRQGKRVAVVDLPVTYPPPAINGVVISGLMTPSRETIFTHPAGLLQEVEQHLGYEWPLLKDEDETGRAHKNFEAFLQTMRRFLDSRTQAMRYVLQKEKLDFAFLQLQCVDFLQHPFWKYLEPEHPAFDKNRYAETIRQFFAPLDEALGKLFAAARAGLGEEVLIAIFSDHGFQRHGKRAELNHWLHAHGFLEPPPRRNASWARWAELIRKLDMLKLRSKLLGKSQRQALSNTLQTQRIDYERSRFYSISSFWGYVYSGERASTQDFAALEQQLLSWRDPDNGQPVVRRVYRQQECYSGAALERLPEIIVEPMPGYTFASKTYFNKAALLTPVESDDFHTGTHASEGIYVLAGPAIAASELWHGTEAHLQDMMPSLLHAMGLPVPAHCDGNVHTEWFESGMREIFSDGMDFELQQEIQLSEREQNEIERRLQMLGYV